MPLAGCSLDREDALTTARQVALRLPLNEPGVRRAAESGKGLPEVEIAAVHTRLLWLPCAGDAYSVREPFTGYALPRRSLDAMLA